MGKNSLLGRDDDTIAKIQTLRFNPLAAAGAVPDKAVQAFMNW